MTGNNAIDHLQRLQRLVKVTTIVEIHCQACSTEAPIAWTHNTGLSSVTVARELHHVGWRTMEDPLVAYCPKHAKTHLELSEWKDASCIGDEKANPDPS